MVLLMIRIILILPILIISWPEIVIGSHLSYLTIMFEVHRSDNMEKMNIFRRTRSSLSYPPPFPYTETFKTSKRFDAEISTNKVRKLYYRELQRPNIEKAFLKWL